MAGSFMIDTTTALLGKALNVTTKRHGLITANVANIDTVGYTPKDIDFKKTLASEMAKDSPGQMTQTHNQHFRQGSPLGISELPAAAASTETVDIDKEMTRLAENNIQYRTSLEMLLRKMAILKTSITEGGR